MAVDPALLPRLRAALAELEARPVADPDPYVEWDTGPGHLPWATYLPPMDRLWEVLFAAAPVPDDAKDYVAWIDRHPDAADPAVIAAFDYEDLAMFVFAIRRRERFSEGLWEEMLDRGIFAAVLARLIALAETH
jgi:hypothetical protein